MENALQISKLTKTYPNGLRALNAVDLQIKQGDFFALLGSNGAGKTTMIGIISGLLEKTTGEVSVLGVSQNKNPNQVKHLIGLMPQEFNFNVFEPIEEILINQAGYYGIARKIAYQRAQTLLKTLGLLDKRKEMAKSLSGGMKRRLMLARALMHQPEILILDEPSAGVDVEIRHLMWDFLIDLNKKGTTIILTTHYLEEAESLCRNIAILDKGQVIEQTSIKQLLAKASQQRLILESKQKLPEQIKLDFSVKKLDDYSIEVLLEKTMSVSQALQDLSKHGIDIQHVRSSQNRLEQLFLNLTKK
jgi:ABC-2 type transport system ATP-binding protein